MVPEVNIFLGPEIIEILLMLGSETDAFWVYYLIIC
jgi:hypothetical protein